MKRRGRTDISAEADEAVLVALREGHREFLRFLAGRTATPADAEDLLQEFYLKVIRSARTVRSAEALRAWLAQVLRRTLTDYYRRAAVRNRTRERLRELGDPAVRIEDDAELAVCRCLYRILPMLPREQADLIWRVDLLGQPRKQVAKGLAISPNNLGVRIHRARRALRSALERYCITCPTHGFLNCACEEARRSLSRRSLGGPSAKVGARTGANTTSFGNTEKLLKELFGQSRGGAGAVRS